MGNGKPSLKERIATYLFGDIIEAKAAAAAVSIRVDDSPGWSNLTAGPSDRPWAEHYQDIEDALKAWRKNFLIRRIVTLTRSYVVGNGITITSSDPDVEGFVRAFWDHPRNHIAQRLGPMCDELTRSGELFPILFTNKINGMSYLRFVPATRIREIETDEDDYETEIRYQQTTQTGTRWWNGPDHPRAFAPYGKPATLDPLMLHFVVNRPIGATRGEGDLTPILAWSKRYSEWLKDRVRLNRQRTRQGLLDIEIADDSMVEEKRAQLRRTNPITAGIYVHGPGEKVIMHNLEIGAGDVKDDGKALRLAIAAGANVGLHYLGEGEGVNYATAREMGEPATRFFADRQNVLKYILIEITKTAWQRRCILLDQPGETPPLIARVTEIARAENESLARAVRLIVEALVHMREMGWIDDRTAATMIFKFAGEVISEDELTKVLKTEPLPRNGEFEEIGENDEPEPTVHKQ